MARYFSDQRIAELNVGCDEVRKQFAELRERLVLRVYKTEHGAEFAKHGLCRRLEILARTIDQVYDLLPPSQEEIPNREKVIDATIAIQGFIMNAFGCLDNIAWVLLHEKDIKFNDGTPLDQRDVGLGKKPLRKKLSAQFRAYLDGKKDWLANLISFRDSLAHRIPLYIPPYAVLKPNQEKYQELEKSKWADPAKSDPKEYARLTAEQLKLCQFIPGMMHSIFDSPKVEFHNQLLNDYVTIDEYVRTMLEELDR